MSYVSSMIVTCGLSEEDGDGGLGAFHEWCATKANPPIRFDPVPGDLGVNHAKGIEVHILVAAGNYFDHDALAAAFPTFPWMFPEDAVLIIHPEHDHLIIVRGDGPVKPLARKRTKDAVLRRMQAALRGMPTAETEPGAMDDLVTEVQEFAPGRRRATAAMIGDDE